MFFRFRHPFGLRCLAWGVVGFVLALAGCVAYARWLEPHWLKVRTVRIGNGSPHLRVCHISDLHYTAADRAYLERIGHAIGALKPDLVCFTGDLADSAELAQEAAKFFTRLGCPVYGVPGNHDIFDRTLYEDAFAATGGQWLKDAAVSLPGGRGTMVGQGERQTGTLSVAGPRPWILLVHAPQAIDGSHGQPFDLILAGHSHGGQIRLPFLGALIVPYGVGQYEVGMYHTPAGPLYVSPGLGTFFVPARFGCRPEITLLEL
jgi:uncharacterized protein